MTTKQTATRKTAPVRAKGATSQPSIEKRVRALRSEFDNAYQSVVETEVARFRAVGVCAETVVEAVRITFDPNDWKNIEAGKAIKALQAKGRDWLEGQTLNLSLSEQRIKDIRSEISAAIIVAYGGGKPSASPSRKALFDSAKQCREALGLARKGNAGKKTKASDSENDSEALDIQRALDVVETALRGKNPTAVMRFREWLDKLPYLTQ